MSTRSASADEVVVEVAEVARRLVGHAGDVGHAGVDARHHVALRGDDLAHVHEGCASCRRARPAAASVGALRMSSSSVSIRSSNLERTGKKLSTSAPMTRYTMTSWGEAARCEGWRSSHSLHVRHGRARPPVHRDDVAVGPEAVHLGVARVLGVGAAGHQVDEVVVVVDPRSLVEALGRLHGEVVEVEVVAQQLGHRAVRRPRRRGRARRSSVPASAASTFSVVAGVSLPSWRRVPCSTVPVSPQRDRSAGWMMPGPAAQPKRAGSNEPGSGASSRRQRDARHGVRQRPGRVRALQQAVGAVAGGHPGVAPARQPAHDGAVVGRGGPQPDPCLEVGRAPRAPAPPSGTRAGARGGPAAVTLTENPAPVSKVPPQATRPPGQGTR